MALQACSPAVTICRQRVANLNRLSDPRECLFTNGSKVTLAPLIAAHIALGDDVSFPCRILLLRLPRSWSPKTRWPTLAGISKLDRAFMQGSRGSRSAWLGC